MIKDHRRVLERGMPVCLADMAGIAGFRKETEIGQFQVPHHHAFLLDSGIILADLIVRMNEENQEDDPLKDNEEKEFFHLAHRI